MKYRTQKEVLEWLKKGECYQIKCSSVEEREMVVSSINKGSNIGIHDETNLFLYLCSITGVIFSWYDGDGLITGKEFLALPKDDKELLQEKKDSFEKEINTHVDTFLLWDRFNLKHNEIRQKAMKMSKTKLKKFIKAIEKLGEN